MKKHNPSVPYTQPRQFTTKLHGQEVRYFSKPGLPDWNRLAPSNVLLAENIQLTTGEDLLYLGCGHGAAAAVLARRFPQSRLTLLDANYLAVQMSQLTLQANSIENAHLHPGISVLPEGDQAYDTVVIDLPKGRKLAQRWLLEAWQALRPGGQFYLAGANDLGIHSAVRDAQALFGQATVLDYKKGNRVLRFRKDPGQAIEAAWQHEPGIAPGTWHSLDVQVAQSSYHLDSLPGVFSYDQLDEGTQILLESLALPLTGHVLDLGCGLGIIGMVAAQAGAAQVDLVDANLLAVASSQRNLSAQHLENARALPSDVLSAVVGQAYDLVLSNPPFHSGKGTDYHIAQAFIEQSWQALAPGGELRLVANRFIRYDRMMQAHFGSVACPLETGRFHVLSAIKPAG
ncbi:MAG: methyltransferase [Chloroflexota bacterium]